MANLPEKGTFKVRSVGPVKTGTSNSTGRDWTIYPLQFEGDEQWYDCFWNENTPPKEGQELTGEKYYEQKGQYETYGFRMPRGGGGRSYNPAAAFANSYQTATQIVHNWLSLDKENYEKWKKAIPEGTDPFVYYLDTIQKVATVAKESVDKLSKGGEATKSNTQAAPTPPPAPANNKPINAEDYPEDDDEEIDLGGL